MIKGTLIIISSCIKDVANILKYGKKAPLRYEKIVVKTNVIKKRIIGTEFGQSALVYTEKWPSYLEKNIIDQSQKIIIKKYKENISWEKSGYIDYRMNMIKKGVILDGVDSKEKIEERCKIWDQIYHHTKRTGRVYSQKEINSYNFRERGGIMISISDKGELIKTGQGNHRLLIAQILEIPVITAQIGVVHVNAFNILVKLRKERQKYENETV